jgi:hypothetical protein
MSFSDLVTLDCQGGLHFASNTFAEANADVSQIVAIIDKSLTLMQSHAMELCPALTDAQMEQFVTPDMAMMFARMEMGDVDFDAEVKTFRDTCPNYADPLNTVKLSSEYMESMTQQLFSRNPKEEEAAGDVVATLRKIVPPSCTYERYSTRKGCSMQLPMDDLGVILQATLAQCPESRIPYVSIKCAGEGCVDVLKTCDSDDACGGSKNTKMSCLKLAGAPTTKETSDFFREAGVWFLPQGEDDISWFVSTCIFVHEHRMIFFTDVLTPSNVLLFAAPKFRTLVGALALGLASSVLYLGSAISGTRSFSATTRQRFPWMRHVNLVKTVYVIWASAAIPMWASTAMRA